MNPKPIKKTKVNDNKQTVRRAWRFIDEAQHVWHVMFSEARRNQSRVQLPKKSDPRPIQWDTPINKDDPSTWVFVTLSVMVNHPPGWASTDFMRTRFDGNNFWAVNTDGELRNPEEGAPFRTEDGGKTITVNETHRDEFLLASSVFPQAITTDARVNTHELACVLKLDDFPNALNSLVVSMFEIGETDPWFPVMEAIHNLQDDPTFESIEAVKDAIDKAIDETVMFEA